MYKAKDNIGIYRELQHLIFYVEAKHDEDTLDKLMVKFRKEGLNKKELRQAISLVNKFLPREIECDKFGCYITQEINGIETITYIPEEEVDRQAIDLVTKKLVSV